MHWLHVLWFHYAWPSDLGNGPEAIQQIILGAILAVVFVPPVHRWAKREIAQVHGKLDHAHALMEHLIYHTPDIPPYVPGKPLEEKSF
jgi:hypothetical protein